MNTLSLRKTALIVLFALLLICQFLIFRTWSDNYYSQNKISNSIQDISKPNRALLYSSEATNNFVEAGIHFNEYMQNRELKSFKKYETSLQNMSIYIDSLNILSKTDNDFSLIINAKKNVEKKVFFLQKELDSLMNKGFSGQKVLKSPDFNIKKYDYDKVLNSISYDTVKKTTETKKKGLLGRIGNALSGKSDVERSELQTTIKMVFNNQEKSGTFEDQLRNTFKLTENFYLKNISDLRKTYSNLKKSDRNLLVINKKILKKSQEILSFYSKSAREVSALNNIKMFKKYNADLKDQKNTILTLSMLIGILTILLLFYTIYTYYREIKLEKALAIIDQDLDKKNQLIGILSHEMRAPLDVISKYSKKLKKTNKDLALKPTINTIEFTSNSIQIIVSQILELIKSENNILKLYNTKINLKKEIQPIVESLKLISEAKKIDIITNFDQSLNTEVWADKVKIYQLFYNLIINSIKFTKEGSITVTAKASSVENKCRLDVLIVDTGIGIADGEISHIFDKFYQSNSNQEIATKGAGLGLDLCKKIVEIHHGKIAVKSQLNKGTEISFFLMLDRASLDNISYQNQLQQKFANQDIKIAIVDDDQIMLQIVKKLVSKVGFEAIAYDRAPKIKEFLNQNVVDAIISDNEIFDYSGIELVKDIKEINNANSTKPIIVITGDPYFNATNEQINGFDEIIIKPINEEEFYQKLLNVL
jgi:signal transduction histidine kinase/CheY-like chemotaxis protein